MKIVHVVPGGFTTMTVINPLERKLAKHTSVQWCDFKEEFFKEALERSIRTDLVLKEVCLELSGINQINDSENTSR